MEKGFREGIRQEQLEKDYMEMGLSECMNECMMYECIYCIKEKENAKRVAYGHHT
jgi:hypothetical protein